MNCLHNGRIKKKACKAQKYPYFKCEEMYISYIGIIFVESCGYLSKSQLFCFIIFVEIVTPVDDVQEAE